jgi:hypothetical protein
MSASGLLRTALANAPLAWLARIFDAHHFIMWDDPEASSRQTQAGASLNPTDM